MKFKLPKFDKNYVLTVLATFAASMILGFLVHGLILQDDYARNAEVFRARMEGKEFFPYLMLGHLIISAGLVWLYRQGKSAKAFVGQGIRFGLGISTVLVIGTGFIKYFVLPLPCSFLSKEIILSTISYCLIGILIAWMSKKA